MQIIYGDLWEEAEKRKAVPVVTTCGVISGQTCELVMGKGAALEAAIRYPGIRAAAATAMLMYGVRHGPHFRYGFIEIHKPYNIGLFQTKLDWRDDSSLELIDLAVYKMQGQCLHYRREGIRVEYAMNYPGIGNGRLTRKEVEPLLQALPDNITVVIKE